MRRLLQSLLLLSLLGAGPTLLAAELQVEDAWLRAGPPTARVMAGYLTLRNPGASDREIVQVTSPAFARVEMHLSRVEAGMARMRPQQVLRIPARGRLELAPGGYHLMLFNPVSPLQPGDTVALTLHDAAGNRLQVSAPVRRPPGGAAGHAHHPH